MKPNEFPVGERLLVSWYIRKERATYSAALIPLPDWELNADSVAEIQIAEWSPSGSHVRLKDSGPNGGGWGGTDGWYAARRIAVIEVLNP